MGKKQDAEVLKQFKDCYGDDPERLASAFMYGSKIDTYPGLVKVFENDWGENMGTEAYFVFIFRGKLIKCSFQYYSHGESSYGSFVSSACIVKRKRKEIIVYES